MVLITFSHGICTEYLTSTLLYLFYGAINNFILVLTKVVVMLTLHLLVQRIIESSYLFALTSILRKTVYS